VEPILRRLWRGKDFFMFLVDLEVKRKAEWIRIIPKLGIITVLLPEWWFYSVNGKFWEVN
jgi:hypothetical protein